MIYLIRWTFTTSPEYYVDLPVLSSNILLSPVQTSDFSNYALCQCKFKLLPLEKKLYGDHAIIALHIVSACISSLNR